MKNRNLTITTLLLIVFSLISLSANACMYSRRQARTTIEQTSYIINEAYEIASYYSYWQTNKVSRAMYYNNYAQDLYFYRNYRSAIRYSLLARQYALDVIDNCEDYWEFFYYTYFGWSFRYGYNYNFAYRSGYKDGYYDGYYAAYCARHNHDYRFDPHHNMHSSWYSDKTYNTVVSNAANNRNSSTVALGRGETGRTPSSSSNNTNGSIGRTNYTNISTSNYFSQTEMAMLKDVPSESTMENDFKRKNPTVTFSDENLTNNTEVVKRNATNASTFTTRTTNKEAVTRTTTARPASITLKDGESISGRSEELKDVKLNIDREYDATRVNNAVTRPTTNSTTTTTKISTPTRTVTTSPSNNSSTTRQNNAVQRSTSTTKSNSNTVNRSVQSNKNNSSVNSSSNNRTTTTTRRTTTNTNNKTNSLNRSNTQQKTSTSTPSRSTSSRSSVQTQQRTLSR